MAKDIYVPARIIGGKIPVKASLGQTVIVTEGPETYTGPVTVTPTESEQTLLTKDKLVTDNISVNPIPSEYVIPTGTEVISVTENGTVSRDISDKENVTVNVNVQNEDYDNALVAFGVESDLADGITALTEYSNEITGESDETLSDAVRTLADGYDDGSLVASLLDRTFTGIYRNDKVTEIVSGAFQYMSGMTEIILANYNGNVAEKCFRNCTALKRVVMPHVKSIAGGAFYSDSSVEEYDIRYVESLGDIAISGANSVTKPLIFCNEVSFGGKIGLSGSVREVRICKIPTSMAVNTFAWETVQDLYVSWSEGEVSGYPWGGTIQNIHYNTIFDSEGNIISST